MYDLLATFWVHQEVVTRHNGYHGPNFKDTWGTMQGGIISTFLFNLVADNVLQTWLEMTSKYQAVKQEGLGINVVRYLGVFYAGGNIIREQEYEWINNVLNILMGLFRRYGPVSNVENVLDYNLLT